MTLELNKWTNYPNCLDAVVPNYLLNGYTILINTSKSNVFYFSFIISNPNYKIEDLTIVSTFVMSY